MIVYVVKRRWFEKREQADAYRRLEGLKPAATVKVEVDNRGDLCALLNALCDPPPVAGSALPVAGRAEPIVPAAVVDEAYVKADLVIPGYVPLFLLDADTRATVAADRARRETKG